MRAGLRGLRVRAGAARFFLVAMGLIVLRRNRESCAYPRLVPVVVGIAVGGALGALGRYGLDEWIGRRTGSFPWGILVVNVTGAFLIGLAVETLEPRFETGWVRPAVVTGFLGAYTTFSTFGAETYELTELGHWGLAVVNVVACAVVGVGAVALGQALGRLA
jgi:CrcB protein